MKSFTTTLATSVALAASFVSAQQTYAIDPSTVSNSTRQYWCLEQKTECPLICLDSGYAATTRENECDATILTYSCICSNGLSPNVSDYSQTLPYFICTQWGTECVANCGQDSQCASNCRQNHPCGAQNPAPPNKTAVTTTMSSARPGSASTDSSGHTVYNGFAGGSQASASASSTHGAAAPGAKLPFEIKDIGRQLGTTLMVGGFFLGFALVL